MASKTDLVDSVSKAVGITKADTLQVVNSVFSELGNLLISQEIVQISDFGKFSAKIMAQRNGINPRTWETIVIPAKARVRFSPFKTLEDVVAEAWPVPEPASTPPPAETPPQETMRAKGVKAKAKAAGTKPKP